MIWACLAVVFGPGLLLVAACLIHDGMMALRERRAQRAALREVETTIVPQLLAEIERLAAHLLAREMDRHIHKPR